MVVHSRLSAATSLMPTLAQNKIPTATPTSAPSDKRKASAHSGSRACLRREKPRSPSSTPFFPFRADAPPFRKFVMLGKVERLADQTYKVGRFLKKRTEGSSKKPCAFFSTQLPLRHKSLCPKRPNLSSSCRWRGARAPMFCPSRRSGKYRR